MIKKLISDSGYRNAVVSFSVTVAFILIIAAAVTLLAIIVSVLIPFIGTAGTVLILGFFLLWFIIHNLLKI